MSLVEDLGAQLRATSAELPTGQVAVAMQRLRTASDLLIRVRQTSVDPLGVPQLAGAVEHAERAAAALRIAQDALTAYLAAIGLAYDAGQPPDAGTKARPQPDPYGNAGPQPNPDGNARPQPAPDGTARPGPVEDALAAPLLRQPPRERLGTWWGARVTQLTGETAADEEHTGHRTDTADLLRRVAAGVRAGDRARLGRELHAVNAAAGLNLSAVTPAVLRRLAGDLLGHEPRPEDLPRLRSAAAERTRSLLPGIAPDLVDTLLARVCRAPATPAGPVHPADSAMTSGVLTGVLLARLGRDPASLDPASPDPASPDPASPDPANLDPAGPDPGAHGWRPASRWPA